MNVTFSNRDFSEMFQPEVALDVNSLEWGAVGGCLRASISARGRPTDLWELMEYLRRPVMVRDALDRPVWWGFVSEARVRIGALEVGATLASMVNAVAVAYSYVPPGTQTVGQRKTTAWATDADSVNTYGRKEFLSSQGGMSDAAAVARRNAILAAHKWPGAAVNASFGLPRGRVRYSGAENSQSATLTCEGWWSTLAWRYASWLSVTMMAYSTTSAHEQILGSAATNLKSMQQVTVGTKSVNAVTVQLYAKKVGAPANTLFVGLYAVDGSGLPTGGALASVNVPAASFSTSFGWVTATLGSEVQLNANTMYAIVVQRNGSEDAANYYVVNVNEAKGYSGGVFKIYNGANYVARSPDADLVFKVTGNNQVDSLKQIRDLVSVYGEMLAGSTIDPASGAALPSYRDGDTTVMEEVLALMGAGGPNGRRLLAEVTKDRYLHVWEEPAVAAAYNMNRFGEIFELNGQPVEASRPPVGQWIKMDEVIPTTVDVTRLADPTLQFVESATWSKMGGLRVQFRGQPGIDDTLSVTR